MKKENNLYLSSMSVLYIEDEEDIREELEEFLSFRVKKLYVAVDGKEGLEFYKNYKPDIILSDIKMPVMNGLAMSAEIKKIDRNTPIVITTAFNDTNYLMQAIEIGIDKYVIKPIKPNSLLESLEDVSKIIYQEKELEKKQQELEELNASLKEKVKEEVEKNLQKDKVLELQSRQAQMGEMISAIAHQWRQPLNILSLSITNFSITFDTYGEIKKNDIDELEGEVLRQIEFMNTTLTEFRNFFKPTKKRNIFSIKGAIKEILDLVGSQYISEKITIEINGDENIKVNGYKNEFEQVIINLLNNAKDAMQEREIRKRKINIDIFKYNSKAVISVVDNAGGIPKEVLNKIFEPYITTKSEEKGTGIGLSMSKTIVEKIDGKIFVQNLKDGAKFTIELPLA